MQPTELLERIAQTLRQEIGPAVDAEYPKTQAFMASVVLQKLARQLALTEQHRAADEGDFRELQNDLRHLLGAGDVPATVPARVAAAVQMLTRDASAPHLCALIEALYAERNVLGSARFNALLGRVRKTLRAQIDRRMEYAT